MIFSSQFDSKSIIIITWPQIVSLVCLFQYCYQENWPKVRMITEAKSKCGVLWELK